MLCKDSVRRSMRNDNQKITVQFGELNENKHNNEIFPNNIIETTKYNLLTWAPKSLVMQFQRVANFYFLIIAILTLMPFSPTLPGSMIGTFAFVLFVTMVKEGIEDYNRYVQDDIANNRIVQKYENNELIELKCWELMPGDVIKIVKDEEITCDTLVVKTSNVSGYCFVDTKNLDGETNLKEKTALDGLKNVNLDQIAETLNGFIECEGPNSNLNSWEGNIDYKGEKIFARLKHILLKGCILKNTGFVMGIILYTGKNTKIMKNSKRHTQKMSNILKTMNKLLYSIFAFDVLICVVYAIFSVYWYNSGGSNYTYIYPEYIDKIASGNTFVFFIISFLTFFVAYSQLIPISLYVGLEIVKLIQSFLIFYDNEMYDQSIEKPAQCRAIDLIEELGQIEFIFSDKTGTLTQNNMILKKCFIADRIFGDITTEKEDQSLTLNGDIRLSEKLNSENQIDKNERKSLEDFFFLLTLCHSVFLEITDFNSIYQGPSPDDIALVNGAKQVGFEFINKIGSEYVIYSHYTNQNYHFDLNLEIPFDSDRKRMSVIVEDKQTNEIMILCKGADNVMLPRLKNLSQSKLDEINRINTEFSKEGLRILVMGKKIIDKNIYLKWCEKYKEASKQGKDLSALYEEFEKDLDFVGCSAIEDKLQDGVAAAISTILSCGIRVWVLTGDKLDTAQEIAKSCKLMNHKMNIFKINTDNFEFLDKLINDFLIENEIDIPLKEIDLDLYDLQEKFIEKKRKEISIIIDGVSLGLIFEDIDLTKKFFCISFLAKSVVCCRVSPMQKSKVVALAKTFGKWITLSIGDGANDVPMIMEAHIGVGIQGKEGTQAVRSADFSIGQFRFLEKLLLIYGRNGYSKISKFICYYFYKNIILVFAQLFFSISNGFSGQIYFADYISNCYNAFWTSWPCLFTFSLEQDVDLKIVKKFPILYQAGQKNVYFNLQVFWVHIITAIFHGVCVYIIPLYGIKNDHLGLPSVHWFTSTVSFSVMIHIVSFKLLIISDFWNIMNITAVIVSIIFYYICLFVICTVNLSQELQPQVIGIINLLLFNKKFWIMIVVGPFIALLPDITLKQIYYNCFPTPIDEIMHNLNDPVFVTSLIPSESRSIKTIIPKNEKFSKLLVRQKTQSFNQRSMRENRKKSQDYTQVNLINNQTDSGLGQLIENNQTNNNIIASKIEINSAQNKGNSSAENTTHVSMIQKDNVELLVLNTNQNEPSNNIIKISPNNNEISNNLTIGNNFLNPSDYNIPDNSIILNNDFLLNVQVAKRVEQRLLTKVKHLDTTFNPEIIRTSLRDVKPDPSVLTNLPEQIEISPENILETLGELTNLNTSTNQLLLLTIPNNNDVIIPEVKEEKNNATHNNFMQMGTFNGNAVNAKKDSNKEKVKQNLEIAKDSSFKKKKKSDQKSDGSSSYDSDVDDKSRYRVINQIELVKDEKKLLKNLKATDKHT